MPHGMCVVDQGAKRTGKKAYDTKSSISKIEAILFLPTFRVRSLLTRRPCQAVSAALHCFLLFSDVPTFSPVFNGFTVNSTVFWERLNWLICRRSGVWPFKSAVT